MSDVRTAPRLWPAIAAPLGITFLLAVAGWLFVSKIQKDADNIETALLRQQGYARLEAGELAGSARTAAHTLLTEAKTARTAIEQGLYLEAKGVADSVYRLIAASLERSDGGPVKRREITPFPPGFDGVRAFLELIPNGDGDHAMAVLHGIQAELAALLPAGSSLTIVEDNAKQLFSLGGGLSAEGAILAAVSKDVIVSFDGSNRIWTLRIETLSSETPPIPDAASVADHLSRHLERSTLDKASWRGWLVRPNGEIVAGFGPGQAGDPVPFTGRFGDWVELDDERLVWLEKSSLAVGDGDWFTAVAVAIDAPEPFPDAWHELQTSVQWSATFVLLTLLTLVAWGWLAAGFLGRRPAVNTGQAARQGQTDSPPSIQDGLKVRRVVRDDDADRSIPEVQAVIVADIDASGRVRLNQALARSAMAAKPAAMPTGSLARLQALHRGRDDMPGSRILDEAKTPVLRELAKRVRPVNGQRPPSTGTSGRTKEILPSLKSPLGWHKVSGQ